MYDWCGTTMRAAAALLVFAAVTAPSGAKAGTVPAGVDAFPTLPGDTKIVLDFGAGPQDIPLIGATKGLRPLTGDEVDRLNMLAPSLHLITYDVEFRDRHDSVVGPESRHAVSKTVIPIVNTMPNFDTVIDRLDSLSFSAPGEDKETKIRILMLDLQSEHHVTIGGFEYDLLVMLDNGSPVCADPCGQFTGNLGLDSKEVSAQFVKGTLDLGLTGPTPTAADLGADLPTGMRALPVSFEIQFLPVLDIGPDIPSQTGEVIFQNFGTGPRQATFAPLPEPGTLALLGTALFGLAALRRRRSSARG